MTRLTDEDIASLLAGERGQRCYGGCCEDANVIYDALAELRERRAADLSDADRADLEWAREMARMHANDTHGFEDEDLYPPRRALAVLDRLLEREGRGK